MDHDIVGQTRSSGMTDGYASPADVRPPLILIVDHDRRMRKYLQTVLTHQRFRVVEAETASEGVSEVTGHDPDLVLVGHGVPGLDGIHVTTRLRKWTVAPIMIVSARNEESEKIATLDAGANDYVTKPFRTGDILARIRVWLRATRPAPPKTVDSNVSVGPLRLDSERRRAFLGACEVSLTPTQYKLYELLMQNADKVLTHEQILFTVWGPGYTKDVQYLRVYMSQLRQKFESDPTRPLYFTAEKGIGYRLRRP
jgi:two-component system KDP operon response regulator KdpE